MTNAAAKRVCICSKTPLIFPKVYSVKTLVNRLGRGAGGGGGGVRWFPPFQKILYETLLRRDLIWHLLLDPAQYRGKCVELNKE